MTDKRGIWTSLALVSENYKRSDKKKLKISAVFLLAFFLVALASQAYKPAIYKELSALKLIPQEEHFTELYFEDSGNLPRSSAKGETLSFSFTIRNYEGADKKYPYSVYLESDGKKFVLDGNTVFIKQNDSLTVKESYTYSQDYAKDTLFVQLPQQNQKIYFLLTASN